MLNSSYFEKKLQVDIPSEPEDDEDDPDGRFAFKRKRGVKYMAVSWRSHFFQR